MESCNPNKVLGSYLIDPSLGLDANLDHFTIVDLWRYDENGKPLIEADCYGNTGLGKTLFKAVRDGDLKAIVHKREPSGGNGTGFIKVDESDFNDISNEGYLNLTFVRLTIHRDDFKAWLKKTNRRLPEGCLLNLWFKDEQSQAEAVSSEATSNTRKKLKTHDRDRSEGLLLIYEITKQYNIGFLDELKAIKAWGKITSREFTSDLIKSIAENKGEITLNGGDKLTKTAFSDKYRKRFE